jgi:hypothetical protein
MQPFAFYPVFNRKEIKYSHMKTTSKIIASFLIILATFSSCYDGIIIMGNGEFTEETRQVPKFNQVYSEGSFNIFYAHGDSTSVKIDCESNLLPYIETSVFNEKLDVKFASHISVSTHKDIDIYITSPAIEKIHLEGSGNIEADSLTGKDMEIELSGSGHIYSNFYGHYLKTSVSGSGNIEIYGECDTLETSISGSGTIDLEAPHCSYTTLTISGSGKAELKGSSEEAEFKILGSGKIRAFSFPVKIAEVLIGGSGNVEVNVSEQLNANISGSGDLYYIGNPRINFSDNGTGSLINKN